MEVTVFEAKDLINVKETKTKLPGICKYITAKYYYLNRL